MLAGFPTTVSSEKSTSQTSSEFQVGADSSNSQGYPSLATLSNGDFVIAWAEDNLEWSMFAQGYTRDGEKNGNEFLNTYTYLQQRYPTIASLANERLVVAWANERDGNLFAQCFNNPGIQYGDTFQVNANPSEYESSISVMQLTTGGFAITWPSYDKNGYGIGAYARLYDSTCTPAGEEFLINTKTNDEQIYTKIFKLNNNGFMATWLTKTYSYDRSSARMGFGQCFTEAGVKRGDPFQISNYTDGQDSTPTIASFSEGGFMATWGSDSQTDLGWDIYAQRFDASCTKVGVVIQVNTVTENNQGNPVVATFINGHYLIAWISNGEAGLNNGIYGQRYTQEDTKINDEFQLNTDMSADQFSFKITGLHDDGFLAVWESSFKDGYGIFGQRFDRNGNKISLIQPSLTSFTHLRGLNSTVRSIQGGEGAFLSTGNLIGMMVSALALLAISLVILRFRQLMSHTNDKKTTENTTLSYCGWFSSTHLYKPLPDSPSDVDDNIFKNT